MKKEGKISESFVYKSHSDIRLLFNMIIKEIVRMNVDRISALILLEEEVVKLKETFTKKNNINDEIKDRIKREINEKVILKKGIHLDEDIRHIFICYFLLRNERRYDIPHTICNVQVINKNIV